jgi:predicted ester cyclase
MRKLRTVADRVPTLQDDLGAAEVRLTALQKELTERKKDLANARFQMEELQGDRKVLTDKLNRARADADNRFAGITLTGRRVLFLVDASGSMNNVDEKSEAPDKWAGVRDTLLKILRSLPDLERYQVIVFTKDATFPLGSDDRWLVYDPKASGPEIDKALAALKPKGSTNLYAAFESAFRFRTDGLDTIYLLSDGLPNVGPGLTAAVAQLGEVERSTALGNHVRKTLKTTWNRPLLSQPRVRINAVGFYYDSPDVGAFLWALARENDGSFVGMSRP